MDSKSSGPGRWVCTLQPSRKGVRYPGGRCAAEALDTESYRELQKVVRQAWGWYTRTSRWKKA